MDYLTDQDILNGCIAGNRQACEAFVRRFSDFIYRSVQHALSVKNISYHRSDLEDLHNTVFVKLFEKRCKKIRQYKGLRGCSVLSWIRLITVRTVIDQLRKGRTDILARKERVWSLDTLFDIKVETPDPLVLMDRKEQYRLIDKGIRSLLPRDQLFLRLHCVQGLPIGEVAGIMNISVGNAHTLKHRAIKRLKDKILKNV